jgi:hypothetical protein
VIEQQTDIWSTDAQAICVTTNGCITYSGRGVMGRGVAKQAAVRFPRMERILGKHLRLHGNHVGVLRRELDEPVIVAFPVKQLWNEEASTSLIVQSVKELVALTDQEGWTAVVLPRPGCGNGRLRWEAVKPLIESFLDDRFLIVHQ